MISLPLHRLLDICHGPRREREMSLYLVFEHVHQDLATYLEKCPAPGLGPDRIKVRQTDHRRTDGKRTQNVTLLSLNHAAGTAHRPGNAAACTKVFYITFFRYKIWYEQILDYFSYRHGDKQLSCAFKVQTATMMGRGYREQEKANSWHMWCRFSRERPFI